MIRSDDFWRELRSQVPLDPTTVNLNAGSFSPTPWPVLQRVEALRRRMAAEPCDFLWRDIPVLLDQSRRELARRLNAAPEDLLLLQNATTGVNLVASSLKMPAESEILTTDQEYGALVFCWRRAAQRRSWTIREVPLPDSENPDDYVEAITRSIGPKTQALYFSHVSSPTGLVLPAHRLCEAARRQGIFSIVDGAHSPGMLPIDLEAIGADFYAGNCHKWMTAPIGAGFLHVARPRRELLEPLLVSWGWDFPAGDLHADSGWGGSNWQRNLEFHGTTDRCALAAIPEAIAFREAIGEEVIFARTRELALAARRKLEAAGLSAHTPVHPELSGAMTAFDYPTVDPLQERERLFREHRIEAPITAVGDRRFLRVSTAWFNTLEEVDRLAEAVMETVRRGGRG